MHPARRVKIKIELRLAHRLIARLLIQGQLIQVRQQVKEEIAQPVRAAVNVAVRIEPERRRHALILVVGRMTGEPDLLELIGALRKRRRRAHALHGDHRQPDHDGNDRDDDQHLDESDRTARDGWRSHGHHAFPVGFGIPCRATPGGSRLYGSPRI